MRAVDDCEPWTFVNHSDPVARMDHRCCECGRTIHKGEAYHRTEGRADGEFRTYKTCRHCEAVAPFMNEMCGGYPMTQLLEELEEHWNEGYASIEFGRLIAKMRRKWHDGADPVPEDTHTVAMRLMRKAVA